MGASGQRGCLAVTGSDARHPDYVKQGGCRLERYAHFLVEDPGILADTVVHVAPLEPSENVGDSEQAFSEGNERLAKLGQL